MRARVPLALVILASWRSDASRRGAALHAGRAHRPGQRLLPRRTGGARGRRRGEAQLSQATRPMVADRPADLRAHGIAGGALHRPGHRASRGRRAAISSARCRTASAPTWSTCDRVEQVLPYPRRRASTSASTCPAAVHLRQDRGGASRGQAGIDVARAQVDKDRADVTFNVTRAYWLLKWARAAEATLDDGISRLEGVGRRRSDDEIDKGKSTYTENDLVRLKLALDTAELTALDVDKAQGARAVGSAHAHRRRRRRHRRERARRRRSRRPSRWPITKTRRARIAPEARMLAAGMRAARAGQALQLANMLPDLGLATVVHLCVRAVGRRSLQRAS